MAMALRQRPVRYALFTLLLVALTMLPPCPCAAQDHVEVDATDVCSPSESDAVCPTSSSSSSSVTTTAPTPTTPSTGDVRDHHVLFVSIAIKGHALPLLRVAQGMKARGYRVSFATHESGRDWVASHGLPFVSAGAFPISADDLRTKLKTMTWDSSNFRGILTMFNDIYVAAARPMFDELLPQLVAHPPALIVMDIASIGAQDLAHKLRVPHVINSPSILFDLGNTASYVPAWGTGFRADMSLWNRCLNLLFPRLLSVALTPPFMQLNKMRYELALPPYRSQHDIFKGARVLLNTAFGLEHPQPLSPLVEPVGPLLPLDFNRSQPHVGSMLASWFAKRSPKEDTTTTTNAAVVYLNLGTMSYIDAWQSEALVDGLTMRSDEPQIKVLWVLPSDQRSVLPANVPPNFKVKSPIGVPSLDVLAHAAVHVVVSHCGMVSAQEALVNGKPLLCIPFHVDQPDVAARVVDAGAGLLLHKHTLTASQVHDAVVALLTNASYTQNARRVGKLLERAGGTHKAMEIIDATLRLGSAHLETIDLALPWHKTAMLDVWTVYASVFCVLAMCVRVLWLVLYFVVAELSIVVNMVFGPPDETAAPTSETPAASTEGPPHAEDSSLSSVETTNAEQETLDTDTTEKAH